MANWTTEQVVEWLKKEGFEDYIRRFQERKINGENLLALNEDTIRHLLRTSDKSEIENQRLIEQFKQKLYEWKIQYTADNNNRRTGRPNSSSTTMSTHGSYSKNLTLSIDMIGTNVKFFTSPSFREHFQQYLLKTFNTECQIRLLETQEIYLTLNGIKQNVKTAREIITNLFQSVQTKIYEDDNTDEQMIYWSQHIASDSIIPVIQQIMDHHNIFTRWEKTAMFYGHLKVIYFTHQSFMTSETYITQILNDEIEYIENIVMPKEKTKNFLKDIDEFILKKQNPQLAIIRYKYPYQLEIKISLFGRKTLVKKTKKKLESITKNHTIQTFQLKMKSHEYEYLIDNCLEELKDIENEYQDDQVKIRIRQKEFNAPQYLIEKIRQKISELMFLLITCQFKKIGDSIILTDEQNKKLYNITRQNNCQIEKIEIKNEREVYAIPNALSQTSNTSSFIIEQSNEFCSSLSMRRISLASGSIEIYLTSQSTTIPRDVTIISSPAAAAQEGIEYMGDNGYFEMRTGKKILFQRWSSIVLDDDKTDKKLKKSIKEFISSTLQNVTTCCSHPEKIVFLTNEWENTRIQQQQFAEYIITEMKQEMEIRKLNWRILFIFNEKQMNFYKEFHQVFIRLQNNQDGFAQFSCSISTIEITISTSLNVNLIKCQNEINTYIKKNIIADEILMNEIDLNQWNQHTINAFYKYCLSKSVLSKIDLTTNLQIQLIGSIIDVEKCTEKYQIMKEILKQKSTLQIPPPAVTSRFSFRRKKNHPDTINPNGYNIYFSFCQDNQVICNYLITNLTGEGYSICQTPLNTSLSQSLIDKSDIILICFSENYSKNLHSMFELNYAKSNGKKLIPFVVREDSNDESSWFSSLTVAELFYDLFDMEIDIEFKNDFDLEYDKLLSVLLHHTKPGITGRTYPQPAALPEINRNNNDYEEAAFGYKSLTLQKVTLEQRVEREKIYQQEVAKRMKDEKIPDDDINELVASLITVSDYLQEILQGVDPDAGLPVDEDNNYSRPARDWKLDDNSKAGAHELLSCIKRWLQKAPNVIPRNIPPFTPTGDINDAIFIIHRSPEDKSFERIYEPFDHSSPNKYFSFINFNSNSYFTNEQTHDYFQKLIEKDIKPDDDMKTIIEDDDAVWDTVSLFQVNNENEEDDIDNEWKTPEEIRKLEELDNPNHIWKHLRCSKDFIELKIKNILELKELCEKSV